MTLLGICFTLEDISAPDFQALLTDIRAKRAFAPPLSIQVRPGAIAQLTIAFAPTERARAVAAAQRLKTLMLRYGVQVDNIRVLE